MKVLHVLSSLCQGGAENYVVDLVLAMRRAGQEAGIAYISTASELGRDPEYEAQVRARLNDAGVPVFRLGHGSRSMPLLGAFRLGRLVRRYRPDVVHLHLLSACLFYAFALLRLPCFYTHHNSRFGLVRRLRWLFRRFRISVVAISATQYRQMVEMALRPACYVYNAIDLERFDPPVLPRPVRTDDAVAGERRLHLVSVTNLRPVKDIPTLIEAFGIVHEQLSRKGLDADLRIVGEGPQWDELEDLCRRKGLGRCIHFLGGRSDIPALLQESDLFVMSSASEGLPIALLEAISSGVPVVVTDVGACREVVESCATGLVVQPGDPRGLAEAILRLILSPELYQASVDRCRRARRRFSIETAAVRHCELYATRGAA